MINQITIRTAKPADLPAVVELWSEASSWLAGKGLDQWQHPPRLDRLNRHIERGEVYIAEDDTGQPIATLSIGSYADPDFWTDADDPGSALYIHRLVVTHHLAGQGLGAALLDWAAEHARRHGYRWLRLDAWRTNQELHNYYRQLGWTHLRTVTAPGRYSGALFQRTSSRRPFDQSIKVVDLTRPIPE